MRLVNNLITKLVLAYILVLLLSDNVYAYIDPATGSYIFQLILAGLLGALFTLKIFWKSVKNFFYNLFSKKSDIEVDE